MNLNHWGFGWLQCRQVWQLQLETSVGVGRGAQLESGRMVGGCGEGEKVFLQTVFEEKTDESVHGACVTEICLGHLE